MLKIHCHLNFVPLFMQLKLYGLFTFIIENTLQNILKLP